MGPGQTVDRPGVKAQPTDGARHAPEDGVDVHIIAQLMEDHRLIEEVLGSLQGYARERLAGRGATGDASRFVAFFRGFVGGCHHDREERVLVPALVEYLEVPAERGPIAALLTQHHTLAATLDRLRELFATDLASTEQRAALEDTTRQYTHGLWAHIDAEDSVWFPESEGRLSKLGPRALPGAEPLGDDERALREMAAQLLETYPPLPDASAPRGAGCVVCPSYGVDCDGLEREWWRQSEWDELDDHLGDHLI